MKMIELKVKMTFSKNPHMINSLDSSNNHPLIRKYSDIPFNNYQMFVWNFTEDSKCTKNDNEDVKIIIKLSLLSIPSSILLLCLISLNKWTIFKLLLTNNW